MAELLSSSESIHGSPPLLTKDKSPSYDAIIGEEKPAGSKYAKATVIGNVRLLFCFRIYIYNLFFQSFTIIIIIIIYIYIYIYIYIKIIISN